MTVKPIDPARVRELFTYDPETGVLSWAKPQGRRVKVGDVAGCAKSNGSGQRYWIIKVDGVAYRRARLVWAYVHGEAPVDEVDHRDRDSLNDRIGNLREATRVQNGVNRVCPKLVHHNLPQGVRPKRKRGQVVAYRGRALIDGHRVEFQRSTPEEAGEACQRALREAHGPEWLPI